MSGARIEDIKTMITIGRLIREKNLKQADICRALDIAPSTLSGWVSDEKSFVVNSPTRLVAIAKFLKCTVEDLVNGNSEDSKNAQKYKEQCEKLEMQLAMKDLENKSLQKKYDDLKAGQLSLLKPVGEQIKEMEDFQKGLDL